MYIYIDDDMEKARRLEAETYFSQYTKKGYCEYLGGYDERV